MGKPALGFVLIVAVGGSPQVMAEVLDGFVGIAAHEMQLRQNQRGVRESILAFGEHAHRFRSDLELGNESASEHVAGSGRLRIEFKGAARFGLGFAIAIQQQEIQREVRVSVAIGRAHSYSRLVLAEGLLVFAELNVSKPEGIVGIHELRIYLQSFLQVGGGGSEIARAEGLFGALILFQGFPGNMQLGYRNDAAR